VLSPRLLSEPLYHGWAFCSPEQRQQVQRLPSCESLP
jgi:hypothetical protein